MNCKNITPGQEPSKIMNAIIEIPENSVVKYEFCEDIDVLKVSRIMQTPVAYPANYGFFPGTLGDDGDPLDCMVLCSAPLMSGVLIQVRPIGVLSVEDQSGGDKKVICVPLEKIDANYKDVKSLNALPSITKAKIEYFFQHYKDLQPESWVKVIGWGGVEEAEKCIFDAIDKYKKQ